MPSACAGNGFTVCPCGYYSKCSVLTALHMVLCHSDGNVALLAKDYPQPCMACFYEGMEPYVLVMGNQGQLLQAAKVGGTLMLLPHGNSEDCNHGDRRYDARQQG